RRPVDDEQGQRRKKRQDRGGDVERGGCLVAGEEGEQRRRGERNDEDQDFRIEAHRRSPRKPSSAWTSTVSKRSRMRNRKMPMTMKAMRMAKATLISTTSGMPLAPVAARMRPFSSDMKPITWLTALRRVTIINRPRRTTERAKARSSRASAS